MRKGERDAADLQLLGARGIKKTATAIDRNMKKRK
jgi:hypothetical protein